MSDDKLFDWLNFDLEMANAMTEKEIAEWAEKQPGGRKAVRVEGKQMIDNALAYVRDRLKHHP